MKIFIHNVDKVVGTAVFNEFSVVPEDDEPHRFVGTSTKKTSLPITIVNRESKKSFEQALLSSQLIVFDLNEGDPEDVEYALKVIKNGEFDEATTLIVVSSVLTWARTPKKEEGGYREDEFAQRRPSPAYERMRSVETLAAGIGASKENLKSYVLCAGVLYGMGELKLASLFKQCWLSASPAGLPVLGAGNNRVPTIHVKDVARLARKLTVESPENSYLLAIDKSAESQLSIVQAIASHMGDGTIRHVEEDQATPDDIVEPLQLDLELIPSSILVGEEVQFDWFCENGLVANIELVCQEYRECRRLTPVKIFITGPPASGKSFHGKKLAEHYNVPHIQIQHVIALAKTKLSGTQLGLDLAAKLKELEDKGDKNPRIPDELLIRIFQWRLKDNVCRNRGYVLDGYPRTHNDAKVLFTQVQPEPIPGSDSDLEDEEEAEEVPEDEEDGVKEKKDEVNFVALPNHVILLKASDEFLRTRVQELPQAEVEGTHNTEEGLYRRLAVWRDQNESVKGLPSVLAYFSELGLETFQADATKSPEDIFDMLRIYVERTGRPFNYLRADKEVALERRREIEKVLREREEKVRLEADRKEAEQAELRQKREQAEKYKIVQIQEHEKELLETRSLPLRNYLMVNVVPTLTEGLVQLCKVMPEDPVDFLAEYLFEHSADVHNPDPQAF
eukprot:GILJ01000857.1.p1 GENE.GILJ01000857.1~~GILJ01000857.1.p1  ORF type:complete len:699 (-),score=133.23 GILJ01000857.1:66-2090(-)